MITCTLWLCMLQTLATGADAYTTNYNMHLAIHSEHDPLARPFVTHGTPLLAISSAGELAGSLYTERRLEQRGHKKLSLALKLAEIGGHGFCTYWNMRKR